MLNYLSHPYVDDEQVSWIELVQSDKNLTRINVDKCIDMAPLLYESRRKSDIKRENVFQYNIVMLRCYFQSKWVLGIYNTIISDIRKLIMKHAINFTEEDISFIIREQIRSVLKKIQLQQPPLIYYYVNDTINKISIKCNKNSIVIYPSGKINLHGLSNSGQAVFIYRWLCTVMHKYRQLYAT